MDGSQVSHFFDEIVTTIKETESFRNLETQFKSTLKTVINTLQLLLLFQCLGVVILIVHLFHSFAGGH